MKRIIAILAFAALLAGQTCVPNLPGNSGLIGINALEPAGSAVPEVGAPVSVRIISESSEFATVLVRYLVGPIEVRRTQLLVPPATSMADIGPDLAAVVEISGTHARGGATPSVLLRLGEAFEAGDVKEYIIPDPADECPDDPSKPVAGQCGCGVPDTDRDDDGTADCNDNCPDSSLKVNPGICGCDVLDTDSDGDGAPDCVDLCPNDPAKIAPGVCGCGQPEDANGNGTPDCREKKPEPITDCNGNQRPDDVDISLGVVDRGRSGTSPSSGGPVLIGGDDADDHGSFAQGANQAGWLYIEDGFRLIGPEVRNGNKLAVCLGCSPGAALNAFVSGFDHSGLPAAGWQRTTITGAGAIEAFFADSGPVRLSNAGIIYMPTDEQNVGGGIKVTEMTVVNARASEIDGFVADGGGLFVHDQGGIPNGWGWLNTLLPGLTHHESHHCSDSLLMLTPEGAAAFPNLTDKIVSAATPWHGRFDGELGGLTVLVTGPCASGAEPVILGGAQVSIQELIKLAPSGVRSPVKTWHSVDARVQDSEGMPLSGVEVSFEVIEGPNAGESGSGMTDPYGMAWFQYLGSSREGTDRIVASFTDGSVVRRSNVVTKVWLGSADCDENGVPDECQADTDGDGYIDACDTCPSYYNPWQWPYCDDDYDY